MKGAYPTESLWVPAQSVNPAVAAACVTAASDRTAFMAATLQTTVVACAAHLSAQVSCSFPINHNCEIAASPSVVGYVGISVVKMAAPLLAGLVESLVVGIGGGVGAGVVGARVVAGAGVGGTWLGSQLYPSTAPAHVPTRVEPAGQSVLEHVAHTPADVADAPARYRPVLHTGWSSHA